MHNKKPENDGDSMMTWKREDVGGLTREYLVLFKRVTHVIADLS